MHKTKAISVPKDLQVKMREHPEVNWSRVACDAFREKLLEIETKGNKPLLRDVLWARIEAAIKDYKDSQ